MLKKTTMQLLVVILAAVVCTVGARTAAAHDVNETTATPTAQQIAQVVETGMKQHGLVGAAVIVLKDGRTVFEQGFGSADLERQVPVRPQTVFKSGSVGKMFTATGIMLLAQEGKLSLDDTLIEYFPFGPEYWSKATLGDALRHRAGVPNPSFDAIDPTRTLKLKQDMSNEELARLFAQWPMDFEPGTRYRYSNSGYVLLGFIIEQVSGQFYGDFLRERLFQPLGMTTARVNEPREIIPDRALGYVTENDRLVHVDYVSRTFDRTADGSLLFTVRDLAKWDAALHAIMHGEDGGFLPKDELLEMFSGPAYPDGTVGVTNYGYGWKTRDLRGHRLTEHTGYWQGFSTYLGRYVDDGITVAMLTNTRNGKAQHIAMSVAGLFNPELSPFESIDDDDPRLTRKLHRIARAYLAGRVERADFGSEAAASIAPAQVARVVTEVNVDPEAAFVLVDRRRVGSLRRNTYRWGVDRNSTFMVTFDLRADGKIARLVFQPAG